MDVARVCVLGPLEVRRLGDVVPVGGERARRVLVLLVARSGAPMRIETLADAVWDGAPPSSWRNTLQTYLSRFRSSLGVRIDRLGDAYALAEESCSLDVSEFEAEVRAGRAARSVGRWREASSRLDAALALWRGPAFDGYADLEQIAPVAARLEEARLLATEDLAEAQLTAGVPDEALVTVNSEAMPVGRERLACLRAAALYQLERPAEALRELTRFTRDLVEETGLGPSSSVRNLEQLIIEQRPLPPPQRSTPRPELPQELTRLRRTELVGRRELVEELLGAWTVADDGVCVASVIIGDAGIGKSRLAAEVAAIVQQQQGAVRYGRATERLDRAHQVFAHAFRDASPELLGAVGQLLPELSNVLPHLVGDGLARSSLYDSDVDQARLHEALGLLAGAAAGDRGLLLILDDLQWASPSTLAAIEHLVTVAAPPRLMVLGLVRRDDPEGRDEAVYLADDLVRRASAQVIELDGLAPPHVAQIFAGRSLVIDGELLHRVSRATGGNPLLVSELAAFAGSLDELRAIVAGGARDVPTAIARLVGDRLRRLRDHGDLLRWAALIGFEFELDVLVAASGAGDALERVEEASRVGLVTETAVGEWQFRHGLTRDAILGDVGQTRAAHRHAAIARAIETVGPEDSFGRLAHHWCEAASIGHATTAVQYSLRAARHRIDHAAPAEARHHLDRALAVIRATDLASPRAEAELHLLDAIASEQMLDEDRRKASAAAAYECATQAEDEALVVEAALERNAFWTQGVFDEVALELLEGALARAGNDPHARCRLLASMAAMLAVSGVPPAMHGRDPVEIATTAVSIAEELADDAAWLGAATSLVVALWSQPAARRQRGLAVAMARRATRDGPLYEARWGAAPALVLGDRVQFERATLLLREIEDRPGLDGLRAYGFQGACLSALLDGRFAEAEQLGARAVELSRDHPNFARVYTAQLFWIAAETDTLAHIEPVARAVVAENSELPVFHAMLGLVLCGIGLRDEAREILDRLAVDRFAGVPRDILWSATIAACAEIAAVCDASVHFPALDELLTPYTEQLVVVAGGAFVYGAVDRFRAMVAECAEEASERFQRAAALECRVRSAPLVARTLVAQLAAGCGPIGAAYEQLAHQCKTVDLPWASRFVAERG